MEETLFDALYRDSDRHWWFRGRRRIVFSLLDRSFRPGGRVLDLGCGAGNNLAPLARYGEVWGADPSPRALAYCRRRFAGRLDEVRLPDLVPYPDASFDLIVMFDVLEHVEDDAGAARAVLRLLRPGGALALTVPALRWLWSAHDVEHGHYRRYHRPALRALLASAGFEVRKLSYTNTFLLPAVAAARFLLPPRFYSAKDLKPGTRPAAKVLEWVFSCERHLIRFGALPLGASLVALCRRPHPAGAATGGDVR